MDLVMRRRLLALLLSIPLAATGAAGVALHVCQSMGGAALGDCDCEKQSGHAAHTEHAEHGAHAHHASGPKLEGQPCCSIELTEASRVVATHEASMLRVEDAPIAFVGLTNTPALQSRFACDLGLLRERAPPNIHGPPLFVRHCSFLN